ncbi:hypothetical protein H0H93_008794, partial [Arthromyces matolae]
MAFPIPDHLPRRATAQDVSSRILSKIDAATNKTLNAALATSWVTELDETITSTKTRLHERIQKDLPDFQRQLAASRSIEERLRSLTTSVETLNNSVSNPELGLIPNVMRTLAAHSELAQEATNARVRHEALSHLLSCRVSLQRLDSLIKEGQLSAAVGTCREVEELFQSNPAYMDESRVMVDMKRKFHAAQARNDEQISDAYLRSVDIPENSPSNLQLIIRSPVQVRQSTASIDLPSILSSLSSTSLSNHLAILRRDLSAQFIDIITKRPATLTTSEDTLNCNFELSTSDDPITRLENLSNFHHFLSSHLLSHLPSSQAATFRGSLGKSTTTCILNNLLLPSLPSSYDLLPTFLVLAQKAIVFEEEILVGLLRVDTNDRPLKTWIEGVSGHYERQRRMQILHRSREIIVALTDKSDTFLVEIEVEVAPAASSSVIPIQDEDMGPTEDDAWGFDNDVEVKSDSITIGTVEQEFSPVKDDAWGFDDDMEAETDETIDETGWGFDEDVAADPEPESKVMNGDTEPHKDTAEAWGLDGNEEVPPEEENAWDDPWDDPGTGSAPDPGTESRPPPAPSIHSPKVATGLQKAANKGKKKHLNGSSSSPSPVLPSPQPEKSSPSSHNPPLQNEDGNPPPHPATKRPSELVARVALKETYAVSERAKVIIHLAEDILTEGSHLASSTIFSAFPQSTTPLGTTLLLTAPAVLDLYRALYPVKFSKELRSAEAGMMYANDCAYLASEVNRMKGGSTLVVEERLQECAGSLKVLSDSWYHDAITSEQKTLDAILTAGAQGFTYTGDQDRYDECESAMTEILRAVRRLASSFK